MIAATTLPYPRKDISSHKEKTTRNLPETNDITEDPTSRGTQKSATKDPSVGNEEHTEIDKANTDDGLSPLRRLQQQTEKQTVVVDRVADALPPVPYTLGNGDTLELNGKERAFAQGDGTFQLAIRYRVKKSSKTAEAKQG